MVLLQCLVCQGVWAQNHEPMADVQAFKTSLEARNSSTETIVCHFVQNKYLSAFDSSVKSAGTFIYQSPDRICLDYSGSPSYKIVLAGGKMMTVSGGRKSVVDMNSNPVSSRMASLISACMSGNPDALAGSFDIEYLQSAGNYLLSVKPKSKSVQSYLAGMDIYLSVNDMTVDKLVMHENEEDYTEYIFTDKKLNGPIPDEKMFDIR